MRQELKGKDKTAWFECVICMVLPDGREENFVGKMEGRIIDKECGGSGFAYDVIFLFDRFQENFWRGYGRRENTVSHRGRAVKRAAEWLRADYLD